MVNRSGADVEEFCARVRGAADPSYTWRRTESGFDLTVEVPEPSPHKERRHTYEVVLRPEPGTYTITDVVRMRQRGPVGQWGSTVERGRARYRVFGAAVDGSQRRSFHSAEGHRLVRGVAEQLGWREEEPASARVARIAGYIGGGIAAVVLIALGIVFLAGGFS